MFTQVDDVGVVGTFPSVQAAVTTMIEAVEDLAEVLHVRLLLPTRLDKTAVVSSCPEVVV